MIALRQRVGGGLKVYHRPVVVVPDGQRPIGFPDQMGSRDQLSPPQGDVFFVRIGRYKQGGHTKEMCSLYESMKQSGIPGEKFSHWKFYIIEFMNDEKEIFIDVFVGYSESLGSVNQFKSSMVQLFHKESPNIAMPFVKQFTVEQFGELMEVDMDGTCRE